MLPEWGEKFLKNRAKRKKLHFLKKILLFCKRGKSSTDKSETENANYYQSKVFRNSQTISISHGKSLIFNETYKASLCFIYNMQDTAGEAGTIS